MNPDERPANYEQIFINIGTVKKSKFFDQKNVFFSGPLWLLYLDGTLI
jgi:hypothetical protein